MFSPPRWQQDYNYNVGEANFFPVMLAEARNAQRWMAGLHLHRFTEASDLLQSVQSTLSLRLKTPAAGFGLWTDTKSYPAASACHCQFLRSATNMQFDKLWHTTYEPKCRFSPPTILQYMGCLTMISATFAASVKKRPFTSYSNAPSCAWFGCWSLNGCSCLFLPPMPKRLNLVTVGGMSSPASAAIYTAWNGTSGRRGVFEHRRLHEFGLLQLVKQDILQPALSIHCLSDDEDDPEPVPD
ncbi:hypothetical protein ZWY2020_027298 [Hordeum vulgare]|nr:hypothetical protein ZWY2020_027298 [Hordeum vulgare]